ncbi:MAG: hypothetical protein IPJ95_06395 [Gemmatimonadetes bacterium]|nr:hypothetical protein [Gemmatimonadota bacterium]MBK7923251.1 hypothetical protein [Gemmatimonadota bacterium]MBK9066713.1 hypothetical protein [Gemmatimonadota bacterium]
MLRLAAIALLTAAALPPVAAAPSRLQVLPGPQGEAYGFTLRADGAAVRIDGGGVVAAGHDSTLTAPITMDLDPGATATLEGDVTLLVLPDRSGAGTTTELLGPRIRVARDAEGRYRVLEARAGRQLQVRLF